MKTLSNIRWEIPKCNLCASNEFIVVFEGVRYWENDLSFRIVKCKKCNLVFLNPRPQKKYIKMFYKTDSYWGRDLISKKTLGNYQKEREKSYGKIYDLIPDKKGKILDIGAGIGLFLSKFKEEGWDVEGVEYSKEASNYALIQFGIKIQSRDFLEKKIINKFDVVTMNNVLEHLYKPLETLIKVNKTLKDDGFLIIAVPNLDSLGFKIFGKNWYPLQPPIHLYHFTPITINKMLKKAGFVKINITYPNWKHNYFSLFESFRSVFTKRNSTPVVIKAGGSSKKRQNMSFIKEAGIVSGRIFAHFFSFLGSKTKQGESIIIYAKKK